MKRYSIEIEREKIEITSGEKIQEIGREKTERRARKWAEDTKERERGEDRE